MSTQTQLPTASHALPAPLYAPALTVAGLGKLFGLRPVLRGIHLTVPEGATVALLGPNGAGKTTLLRILATLAQPSSGSVTLAGLDIQHDADAVRRRIGYVGHQPHVYDDLTAEENLLFFARMYGLPDGPQRAAQLLERVGLRARAHDRVRVFSRGQAQRLALARGILHAPWLLLLDEPDTGLDDEATALLEALVRERAQAGATTIFTTHALARGLALSDTAVVLRGGRIAYDGPASDLDVATVRGLYVRASAASAAHTVATAAAASAPPQLATSAPPASRAEPPRPHAVHVLAEEHGAPSSGLRLFWQQSTALLGKDLRSELRSRQIWLSMALFALLVLVVFNFAFDLHVDNKAAVAPGALWVAFLFAGMLGLGRTLAAEQEKGSLDRLLLCPVDRMAVYLAKLLGNLIFIGAVEVVAVPVFAALYDLPILTWLIVPIVLLGTLGFSSIGTLFAAVTQHTRAREVLLPLLVFPLIVPVVIGAVKATQGLVSPLAGDAPWLGLVAAFDVIFLSISAITFRYVIEE